MAEFAIAATPEGPRIPLVVPGTIEGPDWRHIPFRGETDYALVQTDAGEAIRAEGRDSASLLLRLVSFDAQSCPVLEWRWRADAVQRSAKPRRRDADDVAASIFLVFGDPLAFARGDAVPVLRYAWVGGDEPAESIVQNPYNEDVRSVIVRDGGSELGRWYAERRDLVADFQDAFGRLPQTVEAVALFTDNDQTGESALAYYGPADVACAS